MRRFRPRTIFIAMAMIFLVPALTLPTARAGDVIKAKLASPGAAEEATGSLTLDGYTLAGHLSGQGIDVTISGTVKSSSVTVIVTGRIMPNCSLNRQSMYGEASNEGAKTSITFDFICSTKGGSYGRGDDFLYRLDLGLPPHHSQFPTGTDPGEDAMNGSPGSREVQRNLA